MKQFSNGEIMTSPQRIQQMLDDDFRGLIIDIGFFPHDDDHLTISARTIEGGGRITAFLGINGYGFTYEPLGSRERFAEYHLPTIEDLSAALRKSIQENGK